MYFRETLPKTELYFMWNFAENSILLSDPERELYDVQTKLEVSKNASAT